MKIKRKGPDKVRITCTNTEAQAIAALFNTACIHVAIRAIWPRTFYSDPYSENTIWDMFKREGIDPSDIATGRRLKPSGNPETFHAGSAISDLIQNYLGVKPALGTYPIPVESTRNLPVSKGEREVLRKCRASTRRRK